MSAARISPGEDNACCGVREQYAALPGGTEAVYDCCNLYYYRDADWLGSERLAAWSNRTLTAAEAYAPFGEAYAPYGEGYAGTGWGEQMFTGQGQRLAPGIYDFPFRQYSPTQGRWLSPDPAGLAAVNPANPQTWNAYAYVASRPLEFTDSLGLAPGDCIGDCGQAPPGGYYFHNGQLYYGDSPVSASPWDMLDPSFWDFTIGDYPPVLQQPTGQNGGGHISPETMPISTSLSPRPAAPLNACTQPILNAVNNQFGTGFSSGDVINGFPNGGATNLQIDEQPFPASPAQFNATQPGRYPLSWWTYLAGWGPTLHVTGKTQSDPSALFRDENVGSVFSVDFTAHIDSAYAYNPIGFILHELVDVLHIFGPRNPCP